MLFERDPEEVGPEHPDDLELRMDVQQSVHEYEPDENGRCLGYTIRRGAGRACGSTQKHSVLHIDEREYCCSLDEQGIDCGHGESW